MTGTDTAPSCPDRIHAHLHVDETSPRVIRVGQAAWFLVPPEPPRPRTAAAGRTRSSRWRAGTRRTRKMARRPGPCPASADPWAGWEELGWTTDA